MRQIKCPHCEFVNPATAVSCDRCGATFSEADKIERDETEVSGRQTITRAQWSLLGIIIAFTLACIIYRLLVHSRLEQTSALFIGLPALLAAALALTPRARSATGMIMKGMTIALLMSGPLLGEGFICIIMAAPIFYGVGLVVGLIVDYSKRRREEEKLSKQTFALMLLPFLLFSMEGASDRLSFARDETVVVERVIAAGPGDVEQALSRQPRFDKRLPLYLRMGFPVPATCSGEGLNTGDRRIVHFAGGEGKPGDLVLEVAERESGRVRFRAVSDSSHISHWLDWKQADVSWTQLDSEHTKVRWSLSYARRLDPAWYFGPWERYAVGRAASYLIDTLATPPHKP